MKIEAIKAIKVLRLRPGDIVILQSTKPLPVYVRDQYRREFVEMLATTGHAGVAVTVLDCDMDIELMRKDGR